MSNDSLLASVARLSSDLFLPVRKIAGPFHRRRHSLDEKEFDRQEALPPLPPPWGEEDRWYRGSFPPRQHNKLHPLPHGEQYFADLLKVLGTAEKRVTICGWCLTPLMSLHREGGALEAILADVLRDVSERAEVYLLLWAGAPALFEPTVHLTTAIQRTLRERAPKVRCELDRTASFSHDHHQKAVTVDGRVAYVGGIDLTTFQGDRWDTRSHLLRFGPNWHDVQMRLEGEVVQDVEENFCQRWNAVTGESLTPLEAEVDPSWDTPAQIVRTIPAGFYPFARDGEFGIRHALLAAIRAAKHFIYLENQYLWAPEIVEALCDVMDRRRGGRFRIVVVLPADAYDGRYDNDKHVEQLRKADTEHSCFEAYTLYAGGSGVGPTGYHYDPIYVHAKVNIVDDQWLVVGSANLNRRGLALDSEICVQAAAPTVAQKLRCQLWAEHLGMSEEEVAAADPIDLIDNEWKGISQHVAGSRSAGTRPPPAQVHPYVADAHPLGRFLDLFQSATLEH